MASRILTIAFVLLLAGWQPRAADPEVLHIGFVDSLLREASPDQRKLLGSEFKELVKEITGYNSVILEGLSPASAGRQLDKEKWHLGVFHGVEFAWLQEKYPQLRPLMITTTSVEPVRAVFVVKKGSAVRAVADLQAKNIAMLQNFQCRLYAEKTTGKQRDYFAKVLTTRSPEEALNSVLLGNAEGAIVDTPALAFFKGIRPGSFNRLQVAAESATFPPGVIVYRQGALSDAMVKHLQESMLKVKDSDRGREALTAFRVTGFAPVPADFQQSLTNILQAYPAREEDQ